MAEIFSIRHHKPGHGVIWKWLSENVNSADYIIDRVSITFSRGEDAIAFSLRFGIHSATQNPDLINRKRSE